MKKITEFVNLWWLIFFFLNNYKTQTILLVRQRLKLIWFLTIQVQVDIGLEIEFIGLGFCTWKSSLSVFLHGNRAQSTQFSFMELESTWLDLLVSSHCSTWRSSFGLWMVESTQRVVRGDPGWSDEGALLVIRYALFCGEWNRACECCGLSSLVISCKLSKLVVLYSII